MRVYYDHQIFSRQRVGGISQYFAQLANFYISRRCLDVQLGGKFYICEHLSAIQGRVRIPEFRGSGRLCAFLNDFLAEEVAANVVHSTYYHPKYLKIGGKIPRIVTIHDMIPEKFTESFASNPHQAKRAYVDGADRIICVSETTRSDLIRFFKVPENKIDVIHHGIDVQKIRNDISYVAVPATYVVYVGRRDGYKNFDLLLRAMMRLWEAGSDISLVCVGGGTFSEQEIEGVRRHSSKMLQIAGNDKQLRYILKRAAVLVVPSLYEGFGLPIIEALALDCRLVLANTSCFPEIAQQAAVYFDPKDAKDLAGALTRVISDGDLRGALASASERILPQYSVERMACKTLQTYNKVV